MKRGLIPRREAPEVLRRLFPRQAQDALDRGALRSVPRGPLQIDVIFPLERMNRRFCPLGDSQVICSGVSAPGAAASVV